MRGQPSAALHSFTETMTTTIFDLISHADFLRLTLEAFSRQGYAVEQSRDPDADAVLVGGNGGRIGILCKKYRSAFIGRPVLQQFHGALVQLHCTEGYLIATTECLPDACAFAKDKRITLYNRERTTELLRTAFGEEFIRTGRMPALGTPARTVPAQVRKPVGNATYEKVAPADLKKEQEKAATPVSMPASEPVKAPAPVSEPVQVPEPVQAAEPAAPPEAIQAPEPVPAPEPEQPAGHAPGPEQVVALPEEAIQEEQAEEVGAVESLEPPPSEEASGKNTRTIFCAECNQQTRVPTDQGVIKVKCSECGLQWLYQPEMTRDGEVKTKTVITCRACSQQLNVPIDRGQLNVRCPKCGERWLFTP